MNEDKIVTFIDTYVDLYEVTIAVVDFDVTVITFVVTAAVAERTATRAKIPRKRKDSFIFELRCV